ncbi:alpha/beta hydrolase [Anaerobacillus alkaliphilus]|uniref:Alpha/beta hydrolase n=1 Tax=Anaerobacillus alkaliphilus TaxID=1548597 RepID=A0A4Q0VSI4_9BACI|nr:alpha/beta hydrolase [Anaerobacillus alkaliphilus]RXI98380.1 alpha/beta hydrolase [Anaerobacillus alkaliphilus]
MSLNQTFIKVDHINIYCEYSLNEKPPIFLIHGFASSTYTFNRLLPLLERNFSIIAIDLPGFGRSEKSKSFHYSFANYAKLIGECINYFNLNKVTIVGHSMGGQIALYVAKAIPEKINKLILLGSSGYLQKAKKSLICCSYVPFFCHFVKWYVLKKDVKEYLHNVFYNKSLITKQHIDEFAKPLAEKDFYSSLVRLLRYREGDLTSEELREINLPVLLIWGKEDRVVPVHVGNKLVEDLPNATLVTYKEAGHLITEERPTEVFQQILTYTSCK